MKFLGTVACIAMAALAGCSAPSAPAAGLAKLVTPEVLATAALKYYWKLGPAETGVKPGERLTQLWRLDENLYALTSSNRLLCIDAARGTYKWSLAVGDPLQKVYAPCHAEGVQATTTSGGAILAPADIAEIKPFNAVIINTVGYGLLIDRATGQVVRNMSFKFAANSPGISDGTNFYVGTVDGNYVAVRLVDGIEQWRMGTGDMVTARPQFFGRRLYVASQDGNLYCVQPDLLLAENRHLWKVTTDGPLSADFVVDARGCFVPSQDFRVWAFESLDGHPMWTPYRTQGPLRQAVQVGKKTIFQYADRDRFFAVDLANGQLRWTLPDARWVLAANDPSLLVLTFQRRLLVVNEMLGKVELTLPFNGFDLFVPNADRPILYAASRDGSVVCITPDSLAQVTPEMLREAAVK